MEPPEDPNEGIERRLSDLAAGFEAHQEQMRNAPGFERLEEMAQEWEKSGGSPSPYPSFKISPPGSGAAEQQPTRDPGEPNYDPEFLERLQPGAALLQAVQRIFQPRPSRPEIPSRTDSARATHADPSALVPPHQESPIVSDQTRFIVWLGAGLVFIAIGVGALYQMYTSQPVNGIGILALSTALLSATLGSYIFTAALFNLWLPKPRVDRLKNHTGVSILAFLAIAAIFILVGVLFPKAHPTEGSSAPNGTQDASSATPSPGAHIYITGGGDKLLGFFDGRTAAEGQRLLAPYLGKWIRFKARVKDVQPPVISDGDFMVFVSETDRFSLSFAPSWRDKLNLLSAGDMIVAACRIDSSVSNLIMLEDCELAK